MTLPIRPSRLVVVLLASVPAWTSALRAQPASSFDATSAFMRGNGPGCASALSTSASTGYQGFTGTVLPPPIVSIDSVLDALPSAALRWQSSPSRKWRLTTEGAVGNANRDCAQQSSISRGYVQIARHSQRGGVALAYGVRSFSNLDPALNREGITGSMWRQIGPATLQFDVRAHVAGMLRNMTYTQRMQTYADSVRNDTVAGGWLRFTRQRPVVDTVATQSGREAVDLRTRLQWQFGRMSFDIVAGTTAGPIDLFSRESRDSVASGNDSRNRPEQLALRSWGRSDISFAATSFLDITGGVASLPAQPLIGAPARRIVHIGMAFSSLPRRSKSGGARVAPVSSQMEIERMDSSRVTVRLRVRSARHVELSGEPTSWQAIPMRRVGGEWWEAEVHARPGSYRMNIRVDGKEWSAPPGSVATRDEFGGEVGVIVIK